MMSSTQKKDEKPVVKKIDPKPKRSVPKMSSSKMRMRLEEDPDEGSNLAQHFDIPVC